MAIPPDRLTVFADRSAELTQQDSDNVVRNWNMHFDEKLNDVYSDVMARGIDVVVIQYNFGFFSVANLAWCSLWQVLALSWVRCLFTCGFLMSIKVPQLP